MARSIRLAGVSLTVAAAVAVGAATAATAGNDSHAGHHDHGAHGGVEGDFGPQAVQDLRQATAEFRDVENALAGGRIDLDLCFDQMGEHYADPATFSDGVLDPMAPEALVYQHRGNGLVLGAVEWVSTTPGEVRGVPLHLNEALGVYVLHAWVWKPNPDGLLTDFNRTVGDCPS